MPDFDPNLWPRFLHMAVFERRWAGLGLDDRALALLQGAIAADPTSAPVVKATGGLRKIRFAVPGEGRGKSGAYRIGYFAFPDHGTVALALVWGKNEKANLSAAECAEVARAGRWIQEALEKGAI